MDERCFPSGVFGPVLFRAFSALLRIFSGEVMGHLRFVRVTGPARSLNYHPAFDGNIVHDPAFANPLPNSAGSVIDTFADTDTIAETHMGAGSSRDDWWGYASVKGLWAGAAKRC